MSNYTTKIREALESCIVAKDRGMEWLHFDAAKIRDGLSALAELERQPSHTEDLEARARECAEQAAFDSLRECIAQAEAQEGQSWELSDEDKSALVEEFALEAVDTANKPRREEQERIYNGAAQQGELMMEFLGRKGISLSNIGALAALSPSKDGGEQTPVAWIYEDTLPDGYLSSGLSDRQVETIIDEVLMAEGNMDQLRSRLTALK